MKQSLGPFSWLMLMVAVCLLVAGIHGCFSFDDLADLAWDGTLIGVGGVMVWVALFRWEHPA